MGKSIMNEVTIIDGDVLEDIFENHSGEYDRFTHVVVCDVEGVFFEVISYMYVRNITKLREGLVIVSSDAYPDCQEYAVKNELLKLSSLNPAAVCSLIDSYDRVLMDLYQEFVDLERLDMLNGETALSLSKRLIAFLKTIKVGNYDGDGISWLPQNYWGLTPEEEPIETDYEEYTRRLICGHIKHRRLPMAHIIPIADERKQMMAKLIASISEYDDDLYRFVQITHFAPICRDIPYIAANGLKTLMTEEFRCVKNEESINNNSLFIFNSAQLDLSDKTIPTDQARNNLRYYVGYYLDELDLSHSFITGSAMTAALFHTSNDHAYESREVMIDLLYPKVLTQMAPEHKIELQKENINLWNIEAITATTGTITQGSKMIPFTIEPGADIDIAVDNTVSDDEYKRIAQNHFELIQRYHSYVQMKTYVKPKGDWNYIIYTDDPMYIPIFRTVEIYRSSFRNICSHHTGGTRGCYTARWGPAQFYLTASAVATSLFRATPNYHYFSGRKSNPQDIIIKNMVRGIEILDEELQGIVRRYCQQKNIIISNFPFYQGKNVPYSIFVAPLEYPAVQKALHREREREERLRQKQREREQQKLIREKLEQRDREQERARQEYERQEYLKSFQMPQANIQL